MGIALQLAAQIFDMGVNGALIGLKGDAVQRTQELGPAENPPRLSSHRRQQLELGLRQVDRSPPDRHLHARDVELNVRGSNHVVGYLDGF